MDADIDWNLSRRRKECWKLSECSSATFWSYEHFLLKHLPDHWKWHFPAFQDQKIIGLCTTSKEQKYLQNNQKSLRKVRKICWRDDSCPFPRPLDTTLQDNNTETFVSPSQARSSALQWLVDDVTTNTMRFISLKALLQVQCEHASDT